MSLCTLPTHIIIFTWGCLGATAQAMGLFSEALDSPQPTSLGSLCFGAEQAQAYLCIIATELQGKDYSPKNHQPRRSQHCRLAAEQSRPPDPNTLLLLTTASQLPTLLPDEITTKSHFWQALFYLQSSLSSLPAANSSAEQLISLDYLTRGFLASLSLPTAIMCIYQTRVKRL